MADRAVDRARHAFGSLENIDTALSNGLIDAYDILFVKDANGKPYVGWIDKEGQKVIVQNEEQIIRVDELPTANGDENVVYIYNNECYVWDGDKCVSTCKPADLSELEAELKTKANVEEVTELSNQIAKKVDAETVQTMIEEHSESAIEVVEF